VIWYQFVSSPPGRGLVGALFLKVFNLQCFGRRSFAVFFSGILCHGEDIIPFEKFFPFKDDLTEMLLRRRGQKGFQTKSCAASPE
jgi:hypothetical protein